MFDRVYVISLTRRPERLEAFWGRLEAAWPGQAVEVFPACDGLEEKPPKGWRSTPGAYGCYLSHRAIIHQTIGDGVESVLIFEDDVTFLPGFAEQLTAIQVPADCHQLYLGGEHLQSPEPACDGFVLGRNVNRTHAYAVLGAGLEIIRDHLEWDPKRWTSRHHVDHHYGILHHQRRINAYAVKPWLCGQAAGTSDVDGAHRPERVW